MAVLATRHCGREDTHPGHNGRWVHHLAGPGPHVHCTGDPALLDRQRQVEANPLPGPPNPPRRYEWGGDAAGKQASTAYDVTALVADPTVLDRATGLPDRVAVRALAWMPPGEVWLINDAALADELDRIVGNVAAVAHTDERRVAGMLGQLHPRVSGPLDAGGDIARRMLDDAARSIVRITGLA